MPLPQGQVSLRPTRGTDNTASMIHAHVEFEKEKCPKCGAVLESHILHLTAFIGSSATICQSCRGEVPSGRYEWADFPGKAKVWVLGLSVV
jgi:hypothetical protein